MGIPQMPGAVAMLFSSWPFLRSVLSTLPGHMAAHCTETVLLAALLEKIPLNSLWAGSPPLWFIMVHGKWGVLFPPSVEVILFPTCNLFGRQSSQQLQPKPIASKLLREKQISELWTLLNSRWPMTKSMNDILKILSFDLRWEGSISPILSRGVLSLFDSWTS